MQPRKLIDTYARKCTLGSTLLDKLLRGGIGCGGVTELVGQTTAALPLLSSTFVVLEYGYIRYDISLFDTFCASLQVRHLQASPRLACNFL